MNTREQLHQHIKSKLRNVFKGYIDPPTDEERESWAIRKWEQEQQWLVQEFTCELLSAGNLKTALRYVYWRLDQCLKLESSLLFLLDIRSCHSGFQEDLQRAIVTGVYDDKQLTDAEIEDKKKLLCVYDRTMATTEAALNYYKEALSLNCILPEWQSDNSPDNASDNEYLIADGQRTTFIKVMYAMFKHGVFKRSDSKPMSKDQDKFMKHVGQLFGADLKSYHGDFESMKRLPEGSPLKVFNELTEHVAGKIYK